MDLPNIQHLFQSAEAARKDNLPEWLQLTCLIHDLGKIMYLFGNHETGTSMEQQWAIVGDTFVLGCRIPDTMVFPEFNKLNIDHNKYNELGVYHKHCGLDECKVSWGHDEFFIPNSEKITLILFLQNHYILLDIIHYICITLLENIIIC